MDAFVVADLSFSLASIETPRLCHVDEVSFLQKQKIANEIKFKHFYTIIILGGENFRL